MSLPIHEVLIAALGSLVGAAFVHMFLERWARKLPMSEEECMFSERWDRWIHSLKGDRAPHLIHVFPAVSHRQP